MRYYVKRTLQFLLLIYTNTKKIHHHCIIVYKNYEYQKMF